MNPFDMPVPPLRPAVLSEICTRSAAGEGVVNIIRSMKLDIKKTMESLRRYHVDEVITAKARQRELIR